MSTYVCLLLAINLYPQQKKLNEAILETVKYLNWTSYAIIYEGNYLLSLNGGCLHRNEKCVRKSTIFSLNFP